MKAIINQILQQQQVIAEILGYYDPPMPRDGISEHSLMEIEKKMQQYGYDIPNSYKEFLRIHDGIDDFSCSFSLLGSNEFLKDSYIDELSNFLESGIGYDIEPNLPPFMIGSSNETNTKVFYDYRHERINEDEPIVLEGEPGFLTLHYSFYDFLKCRIEANEKTIKTLIEYAPSK